jgi:hypothetical protein
MLLSLGPDDFDDGLRIEGRVHYVNILINRRQLI